MNTAEAEAVRKPDQESMAISLCVSALERLTADETARVLGYIGGRYLPKLTIARKELDARIEVVEQHAREAACLWCRSLESVEDAAELATTQ
jgi:hypothetical protein